MCIIHGKIHISFSTTVLLPILPVFPYQLILFFLYCCYIPRIFKAQGQKKRAVWPLAAGSVEEGDEENAANQSHGPLVHPTCLHWTDGRFHSRMYQGTNSNTLAAAIFPNLSLNILHMLEFRILSWSSKQQKLTTPSPSWQQMTFGAENDRLLWCGTREARPWTDAFHLWFAFPQCEMVFSLHLVGYVKMSVGLWPRRAGVRRHISKVNLSFWEKWFVQGEKPILEARALAVLDIVCYWPLQWLSFLQGQLQPTALPTARAPPSCLQISREALPCLLKNVPSRTALRGPSQAGGFPWCSVTPVVHAGPHCLFPPLWKGCGGAGCAANTQPGRYPRCWCAPQIWLHGRQLPLFKTTRNLHDDYHSFPSWAFVWAVSHHCAFHSEQWGFESSLEQYQNCLLGFIQSFLDHTFHSFSKESKIEIVHDASGHKNLSNTLLVAIY